MKDHLRRKHKMYKDMYKSLLGTSASGGPSKASGAGPSLQVLQSTAAAAPKWPNEVEGGPLSVLRPETVLHEGPHHSLISVSDPNISTSPNSVQVKNEPLENSDADQ